MMGPRFIVLSGDGINCEQETMRAVTAAGGEATIVHINDLISNKKNGPLKKYEGLILPGGFSFGDELGSGQVLGLKIFHHLREEFLEFVEGGKLILGICNGFQVLVKLGLLPFPDLRSLTLQRRAGLASNAQGSFLDRWVELEVAPESVCVWTRKLREENLNSLDLPIRHGEGRVVFPAGEEEHVHQQLVEGGQIPLRYRDDINGSYDRIAGLCDPSGRIFGLMPHPEAFIRDILHPREGMRKSPQGNRWGKGRGLFLFESAIEYLGGKS